MDQEVQLYSRVDEMETVSIFSDLYFMEGYQRFKLVFLSKFQILQFKYYYNCLKINATFIKNGNK